MTLLRRSAAWFDAHPLALDIALVALVTAAAAALRLTMLGELPFGVHPDEAQVGLDAHRIMDHGWIGIYTDAALGQPAGHAYLSTPAIWVLGDTALAMRITITLFALAAVPLLYALARVTTGRVEAFFASALLAVSYWHLLYSRVAHWSITYGTVLLAVLLCLMLGLRHRRRAWLVAGGVLLGLGVYTYNVYPIAVVAVAVFVVVLTIVRVRGTPDHRWWLRSLGVFWLAALVVALPMIVYVSNPDAYYWKHYDRYGEQGITSTEEYGDASARGKARLIGLHLRDVAAVYTYEERPDYIDASGVRAVFDPLTLVLLASGAIIAFVRRREPMVIAAACCIFVLPLPALLSTVSLMRQPVGAAPFVMFIAALPLAALWRVSIERRAAIVRAAAAAAACAMLAGIATITVRDYFWTWRASPWTRYVYHSEITSAAYYMRDLPDGAYVYFYSERHPLDLETVQYLAPDVRGEDRSSRFGFAGGSIENIDRSRVSVFVLLDDYTGILPRIVDRYPGGRVVSVERGGLLEFNAYEVPAAR